MFPYKNKQKKHSKNTTKISSFFDLKESSRVARFVDAEVGGEFFQDGPGVDFANQFQP
jgi:hypothetical protein